MTNAYAQVQHLGSIREVLALFEKDAVADELRKYFPLSDGIEY